MAETITVTCRECNTLQTTLQGKDYLFYCTNCGSKLEPLQSNPATRAKTEKLPTQTGQSTATYVSQPANTSSAKRVGVFALTSIGLILISSLVTGIGVYLFLTKIRSDYLGCAPCPPVGQGSYNQQSPTFPAKEILRFGSKGTGEGQFSDSPVFAINRGATDKSLYVADQSNGRIQIFDWNGTYKKFIQLNSKEEIKGIEVGWRYVYVLQGNRILQFDLGSSEDFELEGEMGKESAGVPVFNTQGKEIGKSTSSSPYRAMCLGKNGSLYAVDGQNYIVRFDEDQYKRTVKDKIQIDVSDVKPIRDLAVDELGVMYALTGSEILKLAPNGKKLLLNCLECNTMQMEDIEVDEHGRLYIISNQRFVERLDASYSSIKVFTTHGKPLGDLGAEHNSVINDFSITADIHHNVAFIIRMTGAGDKIQAVRYEIPLK